MSRVRAGLERKRGGEKRQEAVGECHWHWRKITGSGSTMSSLWVRKKKREKKKIKNEEKKIQRKESGVNKYASLW